MRNFTYILIVFLCVFYVGSAFGQVRTISGTVKDDQGEPLIGATIVAKGTSNGTSTDLTGSFRLDVPEGTNLLMVSYVGYETSEVAIGNQTQIEVVLKMAVSMLDNIVVTALGVEKEEKTLGYSIQEVSGKVLENNSDPNFLNKLSGQVAGLNISQTGTGPGGTARILIRGSSSLTGNDQPIFVIDGVVVNSSGGNGASVNGGLDYGSVINSINPDDIESINILKGAGAAALYGSLGQNGAIVITTKKGKKTNGVQIAFSSSFVLEQPFLFPEFQNDYGRGSQGTYTQFNVNSYGPKYNGSTVTNWLGVEEVYSPVTDQMQQFYSNGKSLTHNLELSTGNEFSTTRVSANLYDYDSPMPNSYIKRASITLRNTAKLNKFVNMDTKINWFRQDGFNRPQLGGSPDNPVRNFWTMPRNVRLEDLTSYINEQGLPIIWDGRTAGTFNQNPYWSVNLNTNRDLRNRLISSMNLQFDIFPWLKGHLRAGVDYIADDRENRVYENTAYKTAPVASFSKSLVNNYIGNYDFLLTATKKFTDFEANVSIGGNTQDSRANGILSSGDNQVNPGNWTINNFAEQAVSQAKSHKRINSLYSFADLSYKGFLFLSATARNDWTSALPANNRSYFYPSVNLSWVFTDTWDNFPSFIDFGKLRGSYAAVGNDTSPHSTYFTYTPSVGHLGQPFIRVPTTFPNYDLKPERTVAIEFGADLRFFGGKLNADITWYKSNTFNQIFRAPVPASSGSFQAFINAGELQNKGIEIQINGDVLNPTSPLQWNIGINGSRNTPLLVDLNEEVDLLVLGGGTTGISVVGSVGSRNDVLLGSRFQRNASGQLVLDNLGLPILEIDETGNSSFELGHVQPDWMIGMSQSLRYKGLTLNLVLDSQIGGSIYSTSIASGTALGTLTTSVEGRDAWYKSEADRIALGYTPSEWIPTGGYKTTGVRIEEVDGVQVETPVQYFVNPQQYNNRIAGINEAFIYDASFIRINEISLGYQVPASLMKQLKLRGAQVSVFSNNVAFIYKKTPGITPQSSLSSGNSQGIELYSFPAMRSNGIKLNIQI